MIFSEEKNRKREIRISGNGDEVLIDYMYIISALIVGFRSQKLSEEIIEKQLVKCIAGGFEIANNDLSKGEKR